MGFPGNRAPGAGVLGRGGGAQVLGGLQPVRHHSRRCYSPAPGPGDLVALGILVVGLAATGYVLMSQHGRGNVADTGILQEAQALIAAGLAATMCAALEIMMNRARSARDPERVQRIKATQKAKKCRGSRNV